MDGEGEASVAQKRKAENEEAEGASPAKEPRLEEEAEAEPEAPAEVEAPVDADAPQDDRKRLGAKVSMDVGDATLNVVPTTGGRILMTLTDGGLHYLVAGARANVGLKGGRYLFEARIVEALGADGGSSSGKGAGRTGAPKQLVRLGFSTSGSSLFLGETEDSICFDADGSLVVNTKRSAVSQRFAKDQVMGVLLNLQEGSPNAHTIRLYRDGQPVSEPRTLPDALRGKALFPHVAFRSVSVQVHFGPAAMAPLPFKCRMIGDAAAADVEVAPDMRPKDGKCNVVFPVGIPDEGTFEWLETFLERNPSYVEISDRKIVEWATRSGLWKPPSQSLWKSSNDKPEINFGIPALDDLSSRRFIQIIAPLVPRNYVVMEVKSALVKADRQELAAKFKRPWFTRTARVVVGEPEKALLAKAHEHFLQEKQTKMDKEWHAKKAELARRRAVEQRQRAILLARKKSEKERKKALVDARKRAEDAAKLAKEEQAQREKALREKLKEQDDKMKTDDDKDGEGTKADGEEKDTEKKEDADMKDAKDKEDPDSEEKKDPDGEEQKEDEDKEDDDAEDANEAQEDAEAKVPPAEAELDSQTEPPKAKLTEAEKKQWFAPKATNDLTSNVLGLSFGSFSFPTVEDGFDEIVYEWYPEEKAKSYLQSWIKERKVTLKVEDLQINDWFRQQLTEWHKVVQEWTLRQKQYKLDPLFKAKQAEREAKLAEKEAKKESGEDGADESKDEQKGEDGEEAEVDVMSVEDVCSTGSGEPLFVHFSFEDWALLSLRFEMLLLIQSFRRDVADPERIGIHEMHLAHYYSKYYRKTLNTKYYGAHTNAELLFLVKDTANIDPANLVITSPMSDAEMPSFDMFVKLTEEQRRERQRRIDAGDETAKLKFLAVASTVAPLGSQLGASALGATPLGRQVVRPRLGQMVGVGAVSPVSQAQSMWAQQTGQMANVGMQWRAPAFGSRQPVQTRWPTTYGQKGGGGGRWS